MFERISCNHSVFWAVVTGLWQGHPQSCPRAPALRRPLARGDSAPMWVQGQCGTAQLPLVYLRLLNCGNHCVPAVYGVVGEWPWRTTLIWLFFPIFFFFIGVYLLYNAVLVSAVQRSESAICIHKSPPSWAPHPSSDLALEAGHQAGTAALSPSCLLESF